ncbi:MAG: nucleotide-binding protein [Gammaproteobacteria bacterium]|nr:nucleotide-binding protein [Gammaproteobacteria bacterium]
MKKRVFYSWQSDLPNNTNRAFINNALEKAIADIKSDDTFKMIPFLDRDTAGLSGSPDISASIFDKINQSSVFIADVSIVNGISEEYRSTPNPNVLIELGYAVGELGWHKIILVMNEVYGGVECLPFDLRGRKVLIYRITSEAEHKAEERKKVSSILRVGIREILEQLDNPVNALISKSLVPQKNEEDQLEKEAVSKLNVIKSISYTQQKNDALIKEANKYIKLNRLDLAVIFALDITYTQQKNDFLIYITENSIKNGNLELAEKAVSGVTYTRQRNELSMRILALMQ